MARQAWEKREIAQADKQIQAFEAISRQLEAERRNRLVFERIVVFFALLFGISIIGIAWYTKGDFIDAVVKALQSVEAEEKNPSKSIVINCRHPRNRNTPYCVERQARHETEWRSLTRSKGSKKYQFSLHDR